MGKFEKVKYEGVKNYTVFDKKSYKNILDLDLGLTRYSFNGMGRNVTVEVFFDTPNNLLASAGIILSKVIEGNAAYFKVEREEFIKRKTLLTEKKVFIQPAGIKDQISDHALFLIDGITSLFSTTFNIDLENVLKSSLPKIEIETKADVFKVLSGTMFKGVMHFENVKVKNFFSKKRAELNLLKVEHEAPASSFNEFNEFVGLLEKYCKEITPTDDSKFQIALRLTNK